jgi:hypothetical protein
MVQEIYANPTRAVIENVPVFRGPALENGKRVAVSQRDISDQEVRDVYSHRALTRCNGDASGGNADPERFKGVPANCPAELRLSKATDAAISRELRLVAVSWFQRRFETSFLAPRLGLEPTTHRLTNQPA